MAAGRRKREIVYRLRIPGGAVKLRVNRDIFGLVSAITHGMGSAGRRLSCSPRAPMHLNVLPVRRAEIVESLAARAATLRAPVPIQHPGELSHL